MKIKKYVGLTFKYIFIFIIVVILLSIGVYFGYYLYSSFPVIRTNHPINAVDVANTFIVFVTFIFVVATIIISFVIVFYAKQYSQTRELLLSENINDMVEVFSKNQEIRNKLVSKIIEDKIVQKTINENLTKMAQDFNVDKQYIITDIANVKIEIKKLSEETKKNTNEIGEHTSKIMELANNGNEPNETDLQQLKKSWKPAKINKDKERE